MPNWCTNFFIVEGEGVEQFVEDTKNEMGQFSFNVLVPLPEDQKENWYDWQVENWGTKWDTESRFTIHEDGSASAAMQTAWSPPIAWVRAVAKLYPHLTFTLEYEEIGMLFAGKLIIKGEEIVEEKYIEAKTLEDFFDLCVDVLNYDKEDFEWTMDDEEE